MTYAEWSDTERIPKSADDYREIEEYVLRTGPWLREWFSRADIAHKSCVDIGSGSGIFSSMLARKMAYVTSVDLTEAGVVLTARMARFYEVILQPIRADAEKMPFVSGCFDFAFSWGVLHHTSDMRSAVSEMARLIKPGGAGMMMVYHRHSVVYYVHGLYWLLFKGKIFRGHNFVSVQDFYTDGFYHRYLSKRELAELLSSVGLTVVRLSVTQYEKKILPFIPSALDQYLKRRFGMCLVAEFTKDPLVSDDDH